MATELTVQSERAYLKQPHIFQNAKVKVKSTRPGKGGRRWYKDVGLGFRTPKTAIEGNYIGMSRRREIFAGFGWRSWASTWSGQATTENDSYPDPNC